MSLFFLFLFYRRILLYVLFFCLPHKRPGAPAKRKRKDNRSATSVAKASAGFASSSFGTPENGGLRNSPAKAGSDSLLPFSVSGLPLVGKTEADMNKRAAAFASEQPRKGRSMMPDALRPFRGVKRAKQTIREAQPLFLFRSAGITRSFEPAKESGVRARTGRNGTIIAEYYPDIPT